MSRFNQAGLQLLQRASPDETPFAGETLDPALKSPNDCFPHVPVLWQVLAVSTSRRDSTLHPQEGMAPGD